MQTHADVTNPPKLDTPDQRGVPKIGPLVEHLGVATVLKVTQAVSGEIVLEKLVEVLLRTAIEQAGAERALLIFPRGSELWVQAEAKTHGDSVTVRLSEAPVSAAELPESIVRYVARTQEIVILDDASARNPYSTDAYFRKQRLRSILCLPLVKQSTLIALLYLENNIGPNIFAPAKIAVMRVLASAAAISLDNSRLYRELQEREGKIRRLVDANIIGVLISDSEGQIIESNDAFLKMVGYTREELVSGRMCWRNMTPAEWKDASEQGVVQVNTIGVCKTFEKEYYRKDGSRVPVLVGAARFEKNSIVAFAIDLTERKRAEEALKRSEFYLAEGQRLGHAGSWSFKNDLTCDYWSRELYEILGFDPKNGIPTIADYFTRIHPEDRKVVEATIQGMIAAGEGCDLKKRIIRPDGAQRVIRCVGMPVRENKIVTRFVGTLIDITEQEELTEKLRRREAYLAEAQKLTHIGSWARSPATGEFLYCSEELFRIFGWDPQQGLPTFDMIRQRIHPDDRERVLREIQNGRQQKTNYSIDSRILLPDGTTKYIQSMTRYVVNESGEEWFGTAMDLTERKKAEEAIRRSEAYLAETQKISRTGSWAWHPEVGITYWSEESYRIQSFDPRNGLPTSEQFFQRIHPDDQPGMMELMQRLSREKVAVETNFRIVHPDGVVRDIHSTCHPVLNPFGDLIEFIGTMIDVTERKRSGEARRRSEAFLAEGQRLSHTGSWGWNASTGETTWSEEYFRILGLDPKNTNPSLDAFLERVHPDDRIGLRQLIECAIREKKDMEQEFRIVTPKWSVRHLHGIGHAVLNKANELVEFIGAAIDITERKRAEERAQNYNEAVRLALNAFVEELDVDRFLGHVMTGLTKQFQATSCELWLFDDPIGGTSLHLVYQQGKMIEAKTIGLKTGKLHTTWQPSNIGRIPRIMGISNKASLLQLTHLELLKEQGVKMLMVVPLVLGEQNLGVVELRFQEATKFTRDDLDLAQALVHHATLALQLSRLAHRTEQMAVTEERNRMAREIHDTLAQDFAGIVLHSEALGSALGVNKSRSKKALSNIQKLARSGLEEARRSVQALRPKALEGNTISEALKQAAKQTNHTGMHACHFRQRGETQVLSLEAQNELFRIAQEALTNVGKHARAKSVWIDLVFKARQVVLTIRDDGVGFVRAKSTQSKRSYGLATMRERAQRIGAQFEIESAKDGGTSVRICVPLPKTEKSIKPNT